MRHQVKMPRLGDTVTGGVLLLEWLVAEGQAIKVGDPLAVVETDKTTTEVPSPIEGTVESLLAKVDDEIAVGTPIVSVVSG